jgi:hypothetical protein
MSRTPPVQPARPIIGEVQRDLRRSEPNHGALRTCRDRLEDIGHELPAAPDQGGAGGAEQLARSGKIELAQAIVEGELAARSGRHAPDRRTLV